MRVWRLIFSKAVCVCVCATKVSIWRETKKEANYVFFVKQKKIEQTLFIIASTPFTRAHTHSSKTRWHFIMTKFSIRLSGMSVIDWQSISPLGYEWVSEFWFVCKSSVLVRFQGVIRSQTYIPMPYIELQSMPWKLDMSTLARLYPYTVNFTKTNLWQLHQ